MRLSVSLYNICNLLLTIQAQAGMFGAALCLPADMITPLSGCLSTNRVNRVAVSSCERRHCDSAISRIETPLDVVFLSEPYFPITKSHLWVCQNSAAVENVVDRPPSHLLTLIKMSYVAKDKDYDATGAPVPGAKIHKIRITLTSSNVKNLEKCMCTAQHLKTGTHLHL